MLYHGVLYTQAFADQLVGNGVEWLETHRENMPGANWVEDPDLSILDIRNGLKCVVGQLCNRYTDECGCLDGWTWATGHGLIGYTEGYRLGFVVSYDHEMKDLFEANAAMLTATWKKTISERRAALAA